MKIMELFRQLRARRVIRAAVIYLAVLWAALQAADLFAGAEIVSESTVRWMILVGVAGFPVVVLASWFLENPWEGRRWIAIAGDIVVIAAITIAALLFAWQQWFVSFTRPTIAVTPIEATDTRIETRDLADHLGKRFRLLLATRPEIRVTEYGSSAHESLDGMPPADKARALKADYVLAGTLSGRDRNVRLSLQLYGADGGLIWGDTFEGPVELQDQLQGWVLDELWPRLPLSVDAREQTGAILQSCPYPSKTVAILTLARVGRRGGDSATLAMVAAGHDDTSLLHIEKARFYFDQVRDLPLTQRPVIQKLGMQSLELAARSCPEYPEIELLRLSNTREMQLENGAAFLGRHPNEAELYMMMAELHYDAGDASEVEALVREATLLDPFSTDIQCRARALLESGTEGDDACQE
jgi:TolB-like protein